MDRPLRVIDLDGCHAAYSLALARQYSLVNATVFELPAVVPFAREIIDQTGLADRVTVQAGDSQQEGLGCGYDVAPVFGVLNGEPPQGHPALIRKTYDCLSLGGRIIAAGLCAGSGWAGPPEAAILALQMLLATDAGGLDTRDDWVCWLAEAGFAPPRVVPLPGSVGADLTIADKTPS